MKWIGRGVLRIGEKRLGYGDNIPKNFNKDRLKKFVKQRLIGKVIETVESVPE